MKTRSPFRQFVKAPSYGNQRTLFLLSRFLQSFSFDVLCSFWLVVWCANNILVTIVNKAMFSTLSFPYPFALTSLHMAICSLSGCFVVERRTFSTRNKLKIYTFSILFTLNIAIGNVSMQYVSINFNQTLRSLVPVVTMWLGTLLYGQTVSTTRQRSVWPVVIGVALAVYGDRMYVTYAGFVSTVLSVLLASAKVIVSSEFLTGSLKLAPLELLSYMAPAAFLQCVFLSIATGEATEITSRWSTELNPVVDWKPFTVLIISGVLALGLNLTALIAYQKTSPLTCCITAAVKQVLMIVIGTAIFQTNVSMMNACGIITVLLGSSYYSYLSVTEGSKKSASETEDDVTAELSDEEIPLVEDKNRVLSRR